jgi:hypothetical protein
MSFTQLKQSQTAFLEGYLRGTSRTLTEAQASSLFGIQNLRARMSDLRSVGLRVNRVATRTTGKSAYRVSRRDVCGGQYKMFG